MTRLGFGLALVLMQLWSHSVLAQDLTGYEPVNARYVKDGTLTVPEENFRIQAPGKDWEWLRGPKPAGVLARNYLCRNPRIGGYLFLVVGDRMAKEEKDLAKGILSALRKDREAKGGRLENAKYLPSAIPRPGSYRISAEIIMPKGRLFLVSYAFSAARIYSVQMLSDEPAEPAEFTKFARSLTLLAPVTAPPGPAPPGRAPPDRVLSERVGVACAYVSALLISLALGGLVNALAKESMISGGLVAFVFVSIIATLRMVGVIQTNPSPERIGGVIGEALLPGLIAAWAHSRFTKKKQASAAPVP